MLPFYATILLLSVGLLADASAIKGRAPEDSARSIKLPAASNTLDKSQKAPVQPHPVLESSKRVYNDETYRRSAPVVGEPPAKSAPVEPVQPIVAPAPVPVAAPVPVPVPAAAPAPAPVPPVVAPVVVAAPVAAQAPAEPEKVAAEAPKEAVVELRSAAPKEKEEPLPPQSDRSAPIRNEPPAVAPVVAEPVVPVVAVAQSAPVQPAQPVQAAAPVAEQPADSPLQAKKDEPAAEPLPIEVPAPDPQLVLSEPIDSTTKLLIDLDEHVQKFLPAEEQQSAKEQLAKEQAGGALVAGIDYSPPSAKSAPLVPYSSSAGDEPIVPPLPSLDGVEKAASPAAGSAVAGSSAAGAAQPAGSATRQAGQHQNQQQVITQLLDQLDSLQNRIQDTMNQLVARRRYVMSALLRPMGTYVRRVRTNLERLQNRVNQLQAAAVSVGSGGGAPSGQGARPGGFVDAAAIETIRRRIDDISKRISDIVNRIRFSLTPTSAPLNSNGRK